MVTPISEFSTEQWKKQIDQDAYFFLSESCAPYHTDELINYLLEKYPTKLLDCPQKYYTTANIMEMIRELEVRRDYRHGTINIKIEEIYSKLDSLSGIFNSFECRDK